MEINEKIFRKKVEVLRFFRKLFLSHQFFEQKIKSQPEMLLHVSEKILILSSKCVVVTNLSVDMKTFGKYQKVRNDRKDVVRLYNNCTSLQFLE